MPEACFGEWTSTKLPRLPLYNKWVLNKSLSLSIIYFLTVDHMGIMISSHDLNLFQTNITRQPNRRKWMWVWPPIQRCLVNEFPKVPGYEESPLSATVDAVWSEAKGSNTDSIDTPQLNQRWICLQGYTSYQAFHFNIKYTIVHYFTKLLMRHQTALSLGRPFHWLWIALLTTIALHLYCSSTQHP